MDGVDFFILFFGKIKSEVQERKMKELWNKFAEKGATEIDVKRLRQLFHQSICDALQKEFKTNQTDAYVDDMVFFNFFYSQNFATEKYNSKPGNFSRKKLGHTLLSLGT